MRIEEPRTPTAMRLCYVLRRGACYPTTLDPSGDLPPAPEREAYLARIRFGGFEGLETPAPVVDLAKSVASDLGAELRSAGLPIACVRTASPLAHVLAGPAAGARLERAIRFASAVGASVVNLNLVARPAHPDGAAAEAGGTRAPLGGSAAATRAEFESTARYLRQYGLLAASVHLQLAVELHQGSLADTPASALRLVDLVGLDNVGVNPDLASLISVSAASADAALDGLRLLASRTTYWRCSNIRRVQVRELPRPILLRVGLQDGEIDYRQATAVLQRAGYCGYAAVEAGPDDDQFAADAASAAFLRRFLTPMAADA